MNPTHMRFLSLLWDMDVERELDNCFAQTRKAPRVKCDLNTDRRQEIRMEHRRPPENAPPQLLMG